MDTPQEPLDEHASDPPEIDSFEDADLPERPGKAHVLLGLLVVGQLLFLFVANLLGMVVYGYDQMNKPENANVDAVVRLGPIVRQVTPDEHFWRLCKILTEGTTTWSNLTGQPQDWSLFTSGYTMLAFPALEIHWTDADTSADGPAAMPGASEKLLSDNEPANVKAFTRIGKFRLRRLECAICLYGNSAFPEALRSRIKDHVWSYHDLIHAYLRFRLQTAAPFQGRDPPAQIVLLMRVYEIRRPPTDDELTDNAARKSDPTEIWSGPDEFPIARWRPAADVDPHRYPVEWYDPASGQFESFPR